MCTTKIDFLENLPVNNECVLRVRGTFRQCDGVRTLSVRLCGTVGIDATLQLVPVVTGRGSLVQGFVRVFCDPDDPINVRLG